MLSILGKQFVHVLTPNMEESNITLTHLDLTTIWLEIKSLYDSRDL